MMRQIVKLHVEELMQQDVLPGDRYRIAEALKCELGRLLNKDGVPSSLLDNRGVGRLDAGEFWVRAGASAEAIGRQTARALYGGFRR